MNNLSSRHCGFCGRKSFAPCGSAQEAQHCGLRMIVLADAGNSETHPLRLEATLAFIEMSQEGHTDFNLVEELAQFQ